MIPSTLTCNNCGAVNQPQASFCRSCGSSLQAVKPTIYNSATGRLLANVLLKQRYRIIAPIGKGGMGAVYKAEDTMLGNRQVALKEMRQSGLSLQEQKEAADAFRQEAHMLARLQHPNLPNIFDHFEENGRWYLAMSFIEGETLEEYFGHAQGGKLPLEEVLQIGLQLSSVLGYLHNQQPAIIFRDLKPANIMRTLDGHIYLIDFGIARHFKPGQAKDTAYYGSMGYAPPEQYGKAQTTPRSDIYSLGATLYQLVSGHDPSSSPFRFPLLQSLVPSAPPGLTTLLTQMLELDEDKRPASMLLVKQELQALTSSIAPKQGLQTLAPSQAPVVPKQPAKPNPGLSAIAPTQPASSYVASAQSAAKKRSKQDRLLKVYIPIAVPIIVVLIGGGVFAWLRFSNAPTFPANGTFTISNTTTTSTQQNGQNTINSLTQQGVESGDLNGSFTDEETSIVHPDNTSSFSGRVTCTCTIAGKSGTLMYTVTGTSAANGSFQGQVFDFLGTGDLANLHGQGTFQGQGSNGIYQGTYSDQLHFDG